jgi:hypothetical protein
MLTCYVNHLLHLNNSLNQFMFYISLTINGEIKYISITVEIY